MGFKKGAISVMLISMVILARIGDGLGTTGLDKMSYNLPVPAR